MIKAVVFDFDDTLEDWTIARKGFHKKLEALIEKRFDVNIAVFKKTFRKIETDLIMHRSGVKKFDRGMWFRKTFDKLGVKYDKIDIDFLVNYYWDESFKAVKLFPDVNNMIDKVRKDYKIAILTDSDGGKDIKIKRIKKFAIAKKFDLITTGEDVGASKPDPRCFRYVLRKLKVKPQEAIMVGDNLIKDLSGAKSVGMTTVWVKQGYWLKTVKEKDKKHADYTIDKISELPKILRNLR